MDSKSTPSLGTLPVEIKREICEYLCGHCTFTKWLDVCIPDPKSLANLCLTSRTWRDIAQPILYHIFAYNRASIMKGLIPFMKTITRNPELAAHVRCILSHSVAGSVKYDITLNQDNLAVEATSGLEAFALEMVLIHAKNIDRVELPVHGDLPSYKLTRLRSLRVQYQPFYFKEGGLGRIFPYFHSTVPSLKRLELIHWDFTYKLVRPLLQVVPNIDELFISNYVEPTDPKHETILNIAQRFSSLSVFKYWEPMCDGIPQPQDLLVALYPQRDTIKAIEAVSSDFIVDFQMLEKFGSLRTLSLDCRIIMLHPKDIIRKLPRSLEKLRFSDFGTDEDWFTDLVIELSKSVGKLTNLKSVKFIRHERKGNMDHLVRQDLAFAAEAVARNFKNAGVFFEVKDGHKIVSLEEYEEQQQHALSTLG